MDYFFSVFLGTFALEDVAVAVALGLVANNQMSFFSAFLACFLGISIGDLGLYFIGLLLRHMGVANRFKVIKRLRDRLENSKKSNVLTYSVILSRFVPGTRLPTYLMAGFLHYSFWRFFILTLLTVFAWVTFAFAIGESLKSLFMQHFVLTAFCILIIFKLVQFLIPRLSDYWLRRSLLHSWRQWLSFEFWPATLFYLPIIPLYIFFSLKHRSFLAPFYANLEIENSGLIGESKWDFLKYLDAKDPSTLPSLKLHKQIHIDVARNILVSKGFIYPFVLKPDVGQRGYGVRIIHNDFDLKEYLLLANFDIIAQKLSLYQREVGIFYMRHPSQQKGFLFSITDKQLPSVRGDGHARLGDLILQDPRARIIAPTYFARHKNRLFYIPQNQEEILLSECANHCQGAIFVNGLHLKTPELENAIHKIAKQIPNFYFGRIDLRYKNEDLLKKGLQMEIVEINGAGSEATHIWDANTSLFEAYYTLYRQWSLLFAIGSEAKILTSDHSNVRILRFFQESFRVFFRKDPLSLSS
jgi:membrane protein DedA with SNARE-associated domain